MVPALLGERVRMVGMDEAISVLTDAKIEVPDAAAVRRAVLEQLRSEIRVGALPGGTRLRQTQLAERFGVSRMPVRDAIGDLVAEGLAVGMPSGGARVSELTRDDMHHVYAVRAAMEVHAVAEVCAREDRMRTVAQLREILTRAQPLVDSGELEPLTELDKQFHWTIYRGTGNRFVEVAMTPMWAQVDRIMYAVLKLPDYLPTAWGEHLAVTDAIEAGDAKRAQKLMHVHVTNAAERLIQ